MTSVVTTPTPVPRPSPDARPPRPRIVTVVLVSVVIVVAVVGLVTALRTGPPGPPSNAIGIAENRPVPAAVLSIPLVDEHGRTTSLGAFRGKIVVLTSFLTSCQETCPLTTGAFLDMQSAVAAAGLSRKVVFVEASVDPGRDTASRMAAYAAVTGARWPMLTGTAGNIAALWRYFGIFYQKVAEGSPPGIDWRTGRPYGYDINHSDGFLVFDQALHERFVTGAAPDLRHEKLGTRLFGMLDRAGRRNLTTPGRDSWTVPEGLQAVGWVAGRTIAPVS